MKTPKALAVSLAACAALAPVALALSPTGPGEFRLETESDVSYVADGFAVPAGSTITVRPGVFRPEGGPVGVDEVVWRNVDLYDIATFTGKIGNLSGGVYSWVEAVCNNVVTNTAEGCVQCQLQIKNGSTLYGFVMQFRQAESDVKARIAQARYASGKDIGTDLTTVGGNLDTVTDSIYATDYKVRAIADLGFVLREGAGATAAPSEIVIASSDVSAPDEEVFRHVRCLTTERVLLCRNLRICDIVGISGEISHQNINNGAWTEVQGVCLTNIDDAVQMNLMFKTGTRRIGACIRFYQNGAQVETCAHWAGHSYDDAALEAPFGPKSVAEGGAIGASLGVATEPGTSSVAVRNLKVRFRPSTRIVGLYEPCVVKEDGWVKLWDDVSLADATLGPAIMGGHSLDSKWVVASNYLRMAQLSATQSYYQTLKGNTLYSIRFLMQQQFGDIYAKLASARYDWSGTGAYQPGSTPGGEGDRDTAVTNVVDAAVAGFSHTLAIRGFSIDFPAKRRHVVTVGGDFDPGLSPLRLRDVKLALAPAAGETMTFAHAVHGCGVVGVSGLGRVALAADLPTNVGLDVDSGTALVDSARTVGGAVRVKAGAKLEFRIATGSRPALQAESFSIEPGAEVVVSAQSNVSDFQGDFDSFKIVTGCGWADYALDGVTCGVAGDCLSSVTLSVDEDGDIVATVKLRKGTVVVFR